VVEAIGIPVTATLVFKEPSAAKGASENVVIPKAIY